MALNKASSLLLCLLGALALAASGTNAQLQPETVPIVPIVEPVNVTTTTTTTTPAPVTTTTTTTTTAAPATTSSTTTAAPTTSTTTAAPTTSTTTTAAPTTSTTTTAAPTTPAPKPTPTPAPGINHWTYTENNVTCLIVQLAGQLSLSYETNDNNVSKAIFNLPVANHTLGGQCGNTTDLIHIGLNDKNLLDLEFRHTNNDSTRYELTFLQLTIDASQFENAKPNQTLKLYNVLPNYQTHTDMSYHCTRVQSLNLTATMDANATAVASLNVSHLQFEAFHRRADDHFSTAKDCDSVDTPDIVPIAVGCALAALVALVLIAYLVGRRRSQTHGYLSM